MAYEMIALDLDGTLTNSQKKITPATREALKKVQDLGKHIVLASGRCTFGILPLAEELEFKKYGGYILSYNGGCIINCKTNEIVYNKLLDHKYLAPIYEYVKGTSANLVTYTDTEIISAFEPNKYTFVETTILQMPLKQVENFPEYVDFPINKLLIIGEPSILEQMEVELKAKYHSAINIFRSEKFFLEIMPQPIDKAHSLQKLLSSLGLNSNELICCGDGYNDLTMIEYAGLGVAMANAQSEVLSAANYITKSNDEDGIVSVVENFML